MAVDTDDLLPLAVSAESARALPPPAGADIEALLLRTWQPRLAPSVEQRADPAHLGTIARVNPGDLRQAKWGVIFGRGVGARVRDRLAKLLALRSAQVDEPVKVFAGADAPAPDETAVAWLARHKVAMNTVDPRLGVPYYLLIVAPPTDIPFEFQYALDLYWAVGRLWFDAEEDFERYALKVGEYETGPVRTRKEIVLFAPDHDSDRATELLQRHLIFPLDHDADGPLGADLGYARTAHLGTAAKKVALSGCLAGGASSTPALLFTGGHGMQFDAGAPLQLTTQGALVCADWPNTGSIDEDHWFAAADLEPGADLCGLIHFCFACHGAGVPRLDDFATSGKQPRVLAPAPFVSRLPQKMLAQGALAVIAHVDRAWSYGFRSVDGVPQSQGLADVLYRILRGDRVGDALDAFNLHWATLTARLHGEHGRWMNRDPAVDATIARVLVATHDARNYVVLGDPAVRTRANG